MENQSTKDLHNQDDVNPGSQLDKIVGEEEQDTLPNTNGTGGNRPVQTENTVIITDDSIEEEEDDTDNQDEEN
jgi:hypothetical protein